MRTAAAEGEVACSPEVMTALRDGTVPKGDVLAVARIAGISAAKKVPELLPLAHTIGVHGCAVELTLADDHVSISATVRTADRTGVEMEALTAVNVSALAIIDMVRAWTVPRISAAAESWRNPAAAPGTGPAPSRSPNARRGHPRRRPRQAHGRRR